MCIYLHIHDSSFIRSSPIQSSGKKLGIWAMAAGKMEPENAIFFSKRKRPITIKFEDLVYMIKTKEKVEQVGNGKKKFKISKRTILNKVSGIVRSGEILAVLGPSGSGKTTLVTALGARHLSGKLSGSITYNDNPFNSSIKHNIGFVTQHEVHYPHLTVSETLRYTALLRVPDSFSRKQKMAMADEMIESLGLVTCRDSLVGSSKVRGVSGGEKKRMSIGQELLVNPSLFFLDEPTSGLDSTSAQRIMSMLCDIAKKGRTVLTTIHQPSTRMFYMFDKVMLLADGNPIYFGKGSDAMTYFHSIGYTPSMTMNPSDFLLDLANGVPNDGLQSISDIASSNTLKNNLLSAYLTTNKPLLMTEMGEVIVDHATTNADDSEPLVESDIGWSTSWWEQFRALHLRGFKERTKKTFSPIRIIQIGFITLSALLLFVSSGNDIKDQTGLCFYLIAFWANSKMTMAVLTFPMEREMLEKERSSSMYRLSSYYLAKTAGDFYLEFIIPTASITTIYWFGGLYPSFLIYLETLSILLLSTLVSQGLGLAIGSLVLDTKQAMTMSAVILMALSLCGGFFVKNIPVFMRWIKYVSYIHHAYRLLLSAQFSMRSTDNIDPRTESLIKESEGGRSSSLLILFAMLFAFRFVAYLGLRRIGVSKKIKIK
ncbi:ABC transporter G family member [Zostera marina]|uniref:ABC transporter G family member n=1 Tax=Zostera marina TaxID=29655 RepID=A0A0K9NKZ0_ZOSMR|nr:ABC transporter G family member [Zostera marina]